MTSFDQTKDPVEAGQTFTFNVSGAKTDASFAPRDPVIRLTETQTVKRHNRQLEPLKAALEKEQKLVFVDSFFGDQLDWAYRCYHVSVETELPSDDEPIIQQYLYLFNIIVALEWRPSARYMRQLKAAFRRTSDFLYDVTDGFMAFGQVVFAGPELMDCADIQIMASNRLLPRSWVSGLVEERKYMPIRLGRAAWHKNNRVSIPWDEPESYRTLAHEWSHYAFELHDDYLETCQVVPSNNGNATNTARQSLSPGIYTLVLPKISPASESIMATIEGTSELVPHSGGSSLDRKREEWEIISKRYPNVDPNHQPLEGPEHVPLALPHFQFLGSLAGDSGAQDDELVLKDFPGGMELEHCWIYVLSSAGDDARRVVAQGTCDQRTEYDGFRLLGAKKGDQVILIGADTRNRIVARGTIDDITTDGTTDRYATISQWSFTTPTTLPMIDVLPTKMSSGDSLAYVRVRVTSTGELPVQVWLYPLGQTQHSMPLPGTQTDAFTWMSDEYLLPSLDGHVLMRWNDNKIVICTFSQGGGPSTSIPSGPPPISAGSSEGNVMLFFENKEHTLDYSDIKIVTTLIHTDSMHDRLGAAQARSYLFSLASNKALPAQLNPTLIMNFDAAAHGSGSLLIYRQVGSESSNDQSSAPESLWVQIPTFVQPGASFAAAPLNADTASNLVIADPPGPRVERYRLYLVPYSANVD